MTILFAATELNPLARTGGLGDVLEAMPAALRARGHEVSVVLPCYQGLRESKELAVRSTGVQIPVQVGPKRHQAEILECVTANGVQVFLVRQDEYFDRPGLYGGEGGAYEDNAERFIFFSKAVVELARRALPAPQVLHLHDWQTALVPVLVKERRLSFKTVLTIHNLAYQGSFWAFDFGLTNLPGEYFSANGVEFFGSMNLLKGGIVSADAITTVSERYAREILTPKYGTGLHVVLREHAAKLTGILNGADYSLWNPETDRLITQCYSAENLAGKKACRAALLAELELIPDPSGPVFSIVSRLASQKGIDLLLPVLDRLLADDVRLIVLGEGDPGLERDLAIASRRHEGRFVYRREVNTPLAHLVEAGSDITLIPSHYEPCGLTAMYGLKYGTLPIARATGGLYEIVQDYDETADRGTGFLFFDQTAEALWDAVVRARRLYRDQPRWQAIMRRAMKKNFAWPQAAQRYEEIYQRVLRIGR